MARVAEEAQPAVAGTKFDRLRRAAPECSRIIALFERVADVTTPPSMTAGRALSGTAASDGIAIGPAHLLVPPVAVVERQISRDLVPAEVARLVGAVTSTDEQLALLSAGLESEHLHEGHLLLEAHRMMLTDDQIVGAARRLIESDEIAAEWAVRRVIDAIAATFGVRTSRPSATAC